MHKSFKVLIILGVLVLVVMMVSGCASCLWWYADWTNAPK